MPLVSLAWSFILHHDAATKGLDLSHRLLANSVVRLIVMPVLYFISVQLGFC
jgi:hypothetical protein